MKTFLTIAFVLLTISLFSQTSSDPDPITKTYYRSTITVEPAFITIIFSPSVNYEFKLISDTKRALAVQAGYGTMATFFWSTDNYMRTNVKYIRSKGGQHFEAGIGCMFSFDFFSPEVIIGYRYQEPRSRIVFKVGTGLPHLLYGGVGFAF